MPSAILALLLFRLLATTVCVGAGTVGGVFTPTLFAGAALGALLSATLHTSDPILMSIVGMSVFLASVTHAPWMAACMAAELTGQWLLMPLLLGLNLLSQAVSTRISPQSLYAIATPTPAKAIT